MAIEDRGAAWRLGQSWYVLLTLTGGLFSGAAFLYMAVRAREMRWLGWALFYFGMLVWLMSRPKVAGADGTETVAGWAAVAWLGLWIMSIVHVLRARREFLTILDAQEGGTPASVPQRADPYAYATLRDERREQPAADSALSARSPRPEPAPPLPPGTAFTPPPPEAARSATPPPLPEFPAAPPPPPPAPPATPEPPPFSGRKPSDDDDGGPAPPPPPRRPGRQVDF